MRASMLVLAGMLSACATAQESPLTGTWTATDAERNGAPAVDVVGHRLTFAGDSFQIVKPDGALVYGGTYQVDPTAVPPSIDFVNTEGEAAGVTWAGVWRLRGPGAGDHRQRLRSEPAPADRLLRAGGLGLHHGRLRTGRLKPLGTQAASR